MNQMKVFMLLAAALVASTFSDTDAGATAGDFQSPDFSAAAPLAYTHTVGGGAFNDGSSGRSLDKVESLEGADFICGDIVTFLTEIGVAASPTDANQTIDLTFRFTAQTTGQDGAALVDVVKTSVNYGQVENGDNGTGTNPGRGFYGLDSGIADDRQTTAGGDTGVGGSVATLMAEAFEPAGTFPFTPANQADDLVATIRVTDFEAGERIVLRTDVKTACNPGSDPTGNLQGQLSSGVIVEVDGVPRAEALQSGAQTINFRQVGDMLGAGSPFPVLTKTVTTASGTCGVDDAETLNVQVGASVKYCYKVENVGTFTFFNVTLRDDAATPADTSDDFYITLGVWGATNDLPPQGVVTGEAIRTISVLGSNVNIATTAGDNDQTGGQRETYTATDSATVTATAGPTPTAVPTPTPTAVPTPTPTAVPTPTNLPGDFSVTKSIFPAVIPASGANVTFTFRVTNADARSGTLTTLQDDVLGDLTGRGTCLLPVDLAPGETFECAVEEIIGGALGTSHSNVVTAGYSRQGIAGTSSKSVSARAPLVGDLNPGCRHPCKTAIQGHRRGPGAGFRVDLLVQAPAPVNLATADFVLSLQNAAGMIYQATLTPADFRRPPNRLHFRPIEAGSPGVGPHGGLRKVSILALSENYYRIQIRAWIDATGATLADMNLTVTLGGESFTRTDSWDETRDGWRLRHFWENRPPLSPAEP